MTAHRMAEELQAELARHNVPSYLVQLSKDQSAVSIWRGLIARCDGTVIWWTTPYPSRRGRLLITYAFTPQTAAPRLSLHYLQARAQHPIPGAILTQIHMPTNPHPSISGPV